MEVVKISDIKGADYNPRYLSDESFRDLQNSIRELGIIKPIIVRKENATIIAGHQRTKAMTALGIVETPAYVLSKIGIADEVRFNQLHNACELELNEDAPKVKVQKDLETGQFHRVKNSDIVIIEKGKLAALKNTLCKLLIKYGEYGCPICNTEGEIIISSSYAYACKVVGKDMDILCLDDQKIDKAIYYLSKQYGVFSYDNLEKKTYHQRYAQRKRLRDGKKGVANSAKSFLYEKYVLPFLQTKDKATTRILDFGAGQKDYVKKLQKIGWKVKSVDPYHMKDGSVEIDIVGNKADFISIAEDIQINGLYDIVICDSVLNSVDSVQAEQAVINTVIALCKFGGNIFISGRNLERKKSQNSYDIKGQADSYISFFDANGFSGLYRDGEWFYQKFHTEREIKDIASRISSQAKIYYNAQAFEICGRKDCEIKKSKAIEGLMYEWDLLLPKGQRYNLGNIIKEAYEKCTNN